MKSVTPATGSWRGPGCTGGGQVGEFASRLYFKSSPYELDACALMAGALLGSIPAAIMYSFFVEYSVADMTGAVKE